MPRDRNERGAKPIALADDRLPEPDPITSAWNAAAGRASPAGRHSQLQPGLCQLCDGGNLRSRKERLEPDLAAAHAALQPCACAASEWERFSGRWLFDAGGARGLM